MPYVIRIVRIITRNCKPLQIPCFETDGNRAGLGAQIWPPNKPPPKNYHQCKLAPDKIFHKGPKVLINGINRP